MRNSDPFFPPKGEGDVREKNKREFEEVSKEWEQNIHVLAATEDGLRLIMDNRRLSAFMGDDVRWHDNKPNAMLRVVNGCAEIWERRTYRDSPTLRMRLPEIGRDRELAERLVRAWSVCAGYPDAKSQLDRLSLDIKYIHRNVAGNNAASTTLDIHWSGTFTWNGISMSAPDAPIASTTLTIPSSEDTLGDEVIPEVNAAYAAWAKQKLDNLPDQQRNDAVHVGVLTLEHAVTPVLEYIDDDTGRRSSEGGERITHISINGEEIITIPSGIWTELVDHLGFNTSDVVVFTRRQVIAIKKAYSNDLHTRPRARAALIEDAMQRYRMPEVAAVVEVQKIIEANTRETARYEAEVQRERMIYEGELLKYQARRIGREKYFPCLNKAMQKKIELLIDGSSERSTRSINFAHGSAEEIRKWMTWANEVMDEVRRAIPAAEELAEREAKGEVLAHFPRWRAKHHLAWVIGADGASRSPDDDMGAWSLVQPHELALAWERNSLGAKNEFYVLTLQLLTQRFCSSPQMA